MAIKSKRKQRRKIPVLNSAHLAALNLFKSDNLLSRAMAKHLSEFDLTITQFSVLAFLSANSKKGLALNELGEFLSLSSPNITNVVDRLEEKGWVVRTDHGTDRRIKIIRLTPTGEDLERRIFDIHGQRIQSMLAELTEDELQQLITLLRKVRHSLEVTGWTTS